MSGRCLLASAGIVALLMLAVVPHGEALGIWSDQSKMDKQWIGIVYGPWSSSVTPLMNYRISQGHSACIWTLADLDADYGGHGPSEVSQALQDAWASWSTKPKWVVLFADHYAGVPSTSTAIGDIGIPNAELGMPDGYLRGLWPLEEVTGDSIPDIAVGRVSAADSGFIRKYVLKVIQHDTDVNARSGYTGSAMVVEDEDDSGNDSVWVRHLADSLYTNWDTSAQKHLIHYSEYAPGGSAQRLAADALWNAGPGMVLAMGNGSNWWTMAQFWMACDQYVQWSVSELSANGRYPALLDLSCDVNATDHAQPTSCDTHGLLPLTKQLIGGDAQRGACVVIGPMRNTIQYWNFLIGKHLLLRKAAGDKTWGEVLNHALADAIAEDPGAWDHAYEYVLEGDPAAQANRGGVTSVEGGPSAQVAGLRPPYPSPTAIGATLEYSVARQQHVQLSICDISGRRVRMLQDGVQGVGHFTWSWDLQGDNGRLVRPGVYFAQLRLGDASYRQRVIVVR
jgi:hypothetical protein